MDFGNNNFYAGACSGTQEHRYVRFYTPFSKITAVRFYHLRISLAFVAFLKRFLTLKSIKK